MIAKVALGLFALNEIRGVVMSAPVFYGLYSTGSGWWLAACALGGIAASVVVPMVAWKLTR